MSSLSYDGKIVNSSVSELSSISNEFNSLSTSIKQATNKIVSAKGFHEYIGGITSDTFSGYVGECQTAVMALIQMIRQTQIQILSYSQDDADIQDFLDTLDRVDYNSLDLSGIKNHISFGRKASNFFGGITDSSITFGISLLEGVLDFGETGADLVTFGGTAFLSIFTSGYDLLNGTDTTKKMWEETKAKVSEKKVENIFNSFYNNTDFGQNLKKNAYGFETVRGIGKGVGYSSAMIGATVLTGGLAAGSIGGVGTVGVGQLAGAAGVFGFSNGTEEAWADGATLMDGLKYGAASGAWEAAQWAVGAKISQVGGIGDQVAKTIFKDGAKGAATRVGLDTIDSAAEGFVQPALTMIYKDYGTGSLVGDYKAAFEQSGGWENVAQQAVIGGIMSSVGELGDARKILKENRKSQNASPDPFEVSLVKKADTDSTVKFIETADVVAGSVVGGTTTAAVRGANLSLDLDLVNNGVSTRNQILNDLDTISGPLVGNMQIDAIDGMAQNLFQSSDVQFRNVMENSSYDSGKLTFDSGMGSTDITHSFMSSTYSTDFSKSVRKNIDGGYIRSVDHAFNTMTGSGVPSTYKWFKDGSYLPNDIKTNSTTGLFKNYEKNYSPTTMVSYLEQNRANLPGKTYTDFCRLNSIFQEEKASVNFNELKLILFHSEGNVGRIKDVLLMSYSNITDEAADRISERISKEMFNGNQSNVSRQILDNYINSLRKNSLDDWKSGNGIFKSIHSDALVEKVKSITVNNKISKVKSYFGDTLSDDLVHQLAACDGYPSTINSILKQSGDIPDYMLDVLSNHVASNIFSLENLARIKASYEVENRNFSKAIDLTSLGGIGVFSDYSDLQKAMNIFSPTMTRDVYYHMIDSFSNQGLSLEQATQQAKLISLNAQKELGIKQDKLDFMASGVFNRERALYNWNQNLFTPFDGSPKKVNIPEYIRKNYINSNRKVDVERLAVDFSNLMDSKRTIINGSSGIDKSYSLKANELFKNSYLEAAQESNPNRAESVRFMSKVLELYSQGERLVVENNGGKSNSCCSGDYINLGIGTITGKDSGTVFHENGHYVFGKVLNAKYPSDFESVRGRAVANLDSITSKQALDYFSENIQEVGYYCQYRAKQQLEAVLKKNGFTNIDEYRNYLIKKYSNLTIESRKQELASATVRSGNMTLSSYDKVLRSKLDYKNAENCADIQLNSIIGKTRDQIYRTEFADYAKVSSVIDSVTRGDVRYNYGHGAEYFESRSDPNLAAYHELIADYSDLKVSGNNKTINFLRFVLGDELFNMIDNTYENMLR